MPSSTAPPTPSSSSNARGASARGLRAPLAPAAAQRQDTLPLHGRVRDHPVRLLSILAVQCLAPTGAPARTTRTPPPSIGGRARAYPGCQSSLLLPLCYRSSAPVPGLHGNTALPSHTVCVHVPMHPDRGAPFEYPYLDPSLAKSPARPVIIVRRRRTLCDDVPPARASACQLLVRIYYRRVPKLRSTDQPSMPLREYRRGYGKSRLCRTPSDLPYYNCSERASPRTPAYTIGPARPNAQHTRGTGEKP